MEVNRDSQQEFFVDIVGWLETGWGIYKRNWMPFTMVSFIFLTVIILAQFVPYAGNLVVMGPMTAGLFMATAEIVSGRDFKPGTIFKGFKYFIPAFVANLLITLFTTIGFILLIIPGIVIGGLYIFTYLFMVDKGLGFWESMEGSRKVAVNDTVAFALFYFAMGAVNILGLLCMVVGVLVTLPVTTIAMFIAYEKLVGFDTLMRKPEEGGTDKTGIAGSPSPAQAPEKQKPDSADPSSSESGTEDSGSTGQ
jgi:uncharacterized membrane protein